MFAEFSGELMIKNFKYCQLMIKPTLPDVIGKNN